MATTLQQDTQLADFAVLAYNRDGLLPNGQPPAEWKIISQEINGPFAAFAYQNITTNQVVIAYRSASSGSPIVHLCKRQGPFFAPQSRERWCGRRGSSLQTIGYRRVLRLQVRRGLLWVSIKPSHATSRQKITHRA